MHYDYMSICYIYYEKELSENVQAPVEQACKHLKQLVNDRTDETSRLETMVFIVYMKLRRLAEFGVEMCLGRRVFKISEYYEWFKEGVTNALDIKKYEAMKRIERAIELDSLSAVDGIVKYTSSAIDTLAIIQPLKIFWMELNWPDIESSYTFIVKIVDDICQCCVHYAQQMFAKVAKSHENDRNIYEDTKYTAIEEWCLVINDIEYLRQSLPSFLNELNLNEMISKLAEYRNQANAQRCDETLNSFIENALDLTENHKQEIIQLISHQTGITIRTFLIHAMNNLNLNAKLLHRIMAFIEGSFEILIAHLNEANFKLIKSNILKETAKIFHEIMQTYLDVSTFINLYLFLKLQE